MRRMSQRAAHGRLLTLSALLYVQGLRGEFAEMSGVQRRDHGPGTGLFVSGGEGNTSCEQEEAETVCL